MNIIEKRMAIRVQLSENILNILKKKKKIIPIQSIEFKRKYPEINQLPVFFIKKMLDKAIPACLNHSRFEMITKSKVNL